MTTLLSIPAQAGATVACDMTGAEDSLAERLAEYRRLFDRALLSRGSTGPATTFRLAARPGVQDRLLDLVRREAACCPFLSYEVSRDGDRIVWTTTGGPDAPDPAVLGEFLDAAVGAARGSAALAREIEDSTGLPVRVPASRT